MLYGVNENEISESDSGHHVDEKNRGWSENQSIQ